MRIPTAWQILETYKGVNIYDNDGYILVVYQKSGINKFKWLKSLTSAKRWITSNKTYYVKTIELSNGTKIDHRKDTVFF